MSACSRCGAAFECGMADTANTANTNAPCWCTHLPALPSESYAASPEQQAARGCFCPGCLRALTIPPQSA